MGPNFFGLRFTRRVYFQNLCITKLNIGNSSNVEEYLPIAMYVFFSSKHKTCHCCQSRRQSSHYSDPRQLLSHPTQAPNKVGSQEPGFYRKYHKYHGKRKHSYGKKSETRCGKDPCRIVLTQSPECRSQTRSPLTKNDL